MTLLSELQAANLPVISADESGAIQMGPMTDEQQVTFTNVLLQHFQPDVWVTVQADQVDRQALRDGYAAALNVLQGIQAWTAPTNPTVITGVKNMSTILEKLLKFLAKDFRS